MFYLILSDRDMVLFKTALVGTALLVLGVLLLTIIGPYVTVEIQETHLQVVEPHAEFLVGDVVDRSYSLPATSDVLGTVGVSEAPANQTGGISLIVFDAQNYGRWSTGGQASSLYSAEKQGQFNFTFKTEKADTYHFVFDNRASVYKKYVVLTIAYDEVTTKIVPDSRVPYAAWTLVIIGGLVLIYGLLRKPPVTWA